MFSGRPNSFLEWRELARALILAKVPPDEVFWADDEESLLFESQQPPTSVEGHFNVPKQFVDLAVKASLHRDPEKWSLLYRILWRLVYETRSLLDLSTDRQVRKLLEMEGEVRRDCHKMKAFVRFRKTEDDHFVAWHEPSHLIVEAVAPFFARRFSAMKWAILTPDRCAYWDEEKLSFGPGATRGQAPSGDPTEELWKTYYANIFNPARVKISAMVSEMPKKYWHTMPETALIAELLSQAPQRTAKMLEDARSGRRLPETMVADCADLESLRSLAKDCQGCELCHSATQTVFGEGSARASLMLIGEQPGDREDRVGSPFVGPAGELLRRCLSRVNLDPAALYLTNCVKHFRWEPAQNGGKRRIHKRASWKQIEVCQPWVLREIELVQPKVVLLLGSTALQSLVGREHLLGQSRGKPLPSKLAPVVLATVHPSSLLRMQDNRLQQLEIDRFCRDLSLACDLLSMTGTA